MKTEVKVPATPHWDVIVAALANEPGQWKRRKGSVRFWPDTDSANNAVTVFDSGRVNVAGRFVARVVHLGGVPFQSTTYSGLTWNVR